MMTMMSALVLVSLSVARGLRPSQHSRIAGSSVILANKLRGGASSSSFSSSSALHAKKEMLALDFDGVLCKSDGESSYSSIIAAREQWPEECTISYSFEFNRVRRYISELRPIIETGYENMVLVRYILELLRVEGECDVDTGCTVDTTFLLTEWCPALRDELIEKYKTDKKSLIDMFGYIRDKIIEERYQFWVELNEIYPHVAERFCRESVQETGKVLDYCIVTSKQGRFANSILNYFNIEPPTETRMFDLENPMGPKPKVLLSLLCGLDNQASPSEIEAAVNGETLAAMRERGEEIPLIHFVEDRFPALIDVLDQPHLKEHVKCYLVDYGYNTLAEREAAAANPDIEVIDGAGFTRLLEKFIKDK